MASYSAVPGVLTALKDIFEKRMADGLSSHLTTPKVAILGSKDLADSPTGNNLGLYLHRISVDPFGRNRYLQAKEDNKAPQPELPVNLHLLLIAWADKGESEAAIMAWAMQQVGSALDIDISHLSEQDSTWREEEKLQMIPAEMSTEDLLRIWDGLPGNYVLSAPYLVKTLRLTPAETKQQGPLVHTIATPMGNMT